MLNIQSPQAEVTNMKYHREGKGEGARAPLDLKIKCTCSGKVLTPLLGSADAAAFWLDDDEHSMAWPNMGGFNINTKVDNCSLVIDGTQINDATLSVFNAQVKPGGMIELTFSAAVDDLAETDEDQLKKLYASKTSFSMQANGADIVTSATQKPVSEPEEGADQDEDGEEEQSHLGLVGG